VAFSNCWPAHPRSPHWKRVIARQGNARPVALKTSRSCANIKLSKKKLRAGDAMTVEADVSNTGPLAGDEVAELYLHPPQTAISPRLALSGFERTPGRWGNEASVVPP